MLIKEYRIVLPLTVEEYQVAQLYMVAKKSKESTNSGEGIEIVQNEPYENDKSKGQYTYKIIHLKNSLPAIAAAILPASALKVEEKAWNAFPYCKTEYSCPFFGDRLVLSIESMHKPGRGEEENALGCDAAVLKDRVVDFIDIANDPLDKKDYIKEEDPKLFKSEKTGRGPLDGDWFKTVDPVMTCYKLVKVEFRYFGLQTKAENIIHKIGVRDVLQKAHRALFCWIDEWFGMTIEDIRKIEAQTKEDMANAMKDQENNAAKK
ncbi:phosphatidylinositol transfer protein 2 [Cavenderia fasciculata]|uniref:Phosphatidylinositol transfer protein 2 n=1 Tax=Cavenderia fasciculata TaxID=261658 RepID=F4Q2P4_CACFS|nr:phosphatidylinositol transfer protein 2 [Cavenderia fasciculata]EGG17511.1 phosphatidylinositol transfer protein 2 [Cavenderia fasciculata]|eukprot:XP_004355995.1 phosphatidylinositol transfer protein 2 [Cavenderia fasciculata]